MNREEELALALETCLEAATRQGLTLEAALERFPEFRDELGPLLRTAVLLQARPQIAPSTAFRVASHQRLMAAIQARPRRPGFLGFFPLPDRSGLGRLSSYPSAVAASLLAFVLLGSLTVTASASALPGELLYPVKLAAESVQLAVSSEPEREQLRLTFAERRLVEALELAARGETRGVGEAADSYGQVVELATETLASPPSGERAQRLGRALEEHREVLEEAVELVPLPARPAIERAKEASSRGLERAQEVLASLREAEAPPDEAAAGEPPLPPLRPPPGPSRAEVKPAAERRGAEETRRPEPTRAEDRRRPEATAEERARPEPTEAPERPATERVRPEVPRREPARAEERPGPTPTRVEEVRRPPATREERRAPEEARERERRVPEEERRRAEDRRGTPAPVRERSPVPAPAAEKDSGRERESRLRERLQELRARRGEPAATPQARPTPAREQPEQRDRRGEERRPAGPRTEDQGPRN